MNKKGIKKIEILNELSKLATPDELPITFFNYCRDIWAAFNLGRDYELADGGRIEDKNGTETSPSAGRED